MNRFGRAAGIGIAAAVAFGALAGWTIHRWTVLPLAPTPLLPPGARVAPGEPAVVAFPDQLFLTRVATFHDELFSYLMLEHYRLTPPFQGDELLLHAAETPAGTEYQIDLVLSSDYIAAVDHAAALAAAGHIEGFSLVRLADTAVNAYRDQTRLFTAAYNLPARRKLEDLPPRELRDLLRRVLRFKSTTDPRIRQKIEPVPQPLGAPEAQRLAGDIIEVAHFYDLPLDLFLGIGAMENNYMEVRGDLKNSLWKRRPAKDDIILQRRKGRVRVLNDSAGRWQITRETLRYVHRLYLADQRDYSRLSPHLRPPRQLDVNHVDSDSLTTYAGLLLRQLLDEFHGDTAKAVGAYNGGPARPNMRYESGVRTVAAHLRAILERAAALNGESVLNVRWLRSAPPAPARPRPRRRARR